MNTEMIRETLQQMNHNDLVEFAMKLGIDRGFGIMTRGMAQMFYSTIDTGKTLIFLDLANIHAANHKYTMNTVDQFVSSVLDQFRHNDTWIKWAGDEIVCILENTDTDIAAFIDRLDNVMAEHNLYAVYGVVTTSTDLVESVKRADAIVSATKLDLELSGKKPDRNEEYRRLDSVTVYA